MFYRFQDYTLISVWRKRNKELSSMKPTQGIGLRAAARLLYENLKRER